MIVPLDYIVNHEVVLSKAFPLGLKHLKISPEKDRPLVYQEESRDFYRFSVRVSQLLMHPL